MKTFSHKLFIFSQLLFLRTTIQPFINNTISPFAFFLFSILRGKSSQTMHLILYPIPFIRFPICPMHYSFSVFQVIVILTNIFLIIPPYHSTFPMHLIIHPLSAIFSVIIPFHAACPVKIFVFEITFIHISIFICQTTLPMFYIVLKLAYILLLRIQIPLSTLSMFLIKHPHPFINDPGMCMYQPPISMLLIILPLTFISCAICSNYYTFSIIHIIGSIYLSLVHCAIIVLKNIP